MATYESYKTGDHEFSNVSFPIVTFYKLIDHADLNASFQYDIPIEAGKIVLGVSGLVTETFTGGTPVIDIGDGSDADGFIDSTQTDLAVTADAFACSIGFSTNAYAKGRYYAAAGVVRLTCATGLTAGKIKLFVHMLDTSTNWRTTGQF